MATARGLTLLILLLVGLTIVTVRGAAGTPPMDAPQRDLTDSIPDSAFETGPWHAAASQEKFGVSISPARGVVISPQSALDTGPPSINRFRFSSR